MPLPEGSPTQCCVDRPSLSLQPRYLPGVPIFHRWEGFYAGGHFGYSTAGADFGNSTPALSNFLNAPRNDVVLSRFVRLHSCVCERSTTIE